MYNEVYKNSKVRKFYNQIYDWAKSLPENVIVKKKTEAENLFKKIGITFSVYNNFDSTERLIPFDMFPRIISSAEWKKIKKGVIQRALAVNAFLNDIYNSGEIIKAKLIPEDLIYKNPAYEIKMIGFKVPKKIYSPIIGSDIVRINEKIFKPVIKYAEAQIQAILDDPIKAIAKAIAMSNPATAAMWLAVVEGVDAAIAGEDIEGILKAAAKGYVQGKASEYAKELGTKVGTRAGDVFGDVVGDVVSKVVTSGTEQAINAIADGRDPLEAFKMGAISTGVGLTLGKINTELGGKYEELPDVVKNVIQASITDLVINGEVSDLTLARAITNSVITAEAVDEFLDKIGLGDWTPEDATDRMNEGTLGTITSVIQNTVAYAAAGESGSDAFGRTLVNRIVTEAVRSYKDGTLFEDMQDTFDRLSGKYTAARENGEAVDAYVTKHQAEVEEYNELTKAIGEQATEVQALEDARDAARELSSISGIDIVYALVALPAKLSAMQPLSSPPLKTNPGEASASR